MNLLKNQVRNYCCHHLEFFTNNNNKFVLQYFIFHTATLLHYEKFGPFDLLTQITICDWACKNQPCEYKLHLLHNEYLQF